MMLMMLPGGSDWDSGDAPDALRDSVWAPNDAHDARLPAQTNIINSINNSSNSPNDAHGLAHRIRLGTQ